MLPLLYSLLLQAPGPAFKSSSELVVLHVAVVDHRWRDQIDAARALILRRLNARLGPGTVRGFQFGPLPATDLRATEAPATLREDCPGALACDVSEAFSRAASAAHRRQRA